MIYPNVEIRILQGPVPISLGVKSLSPGQSLLVTFMDLEPGYGSVIVKLIHADGGSEAIATIAQRGLGDETRP